MQRITLCLTAIASAYVASAFAAHAWELPSRLISRMQNEYNGRVVGVSQNSTDKEQVCEPRLYEMVIDDSVQTGYGMVCQQPDGSWAPDRRYNVQLLTPQGKVKLITVDATTGEILQVQQ